MNNKDRQVLEKIYNHVILVLKYCENCKRLDEFQAESMRVDACVFNLMQIGELAKISLADEFKETNNSMETALWYAKQDCSRIFWCGHEYSMGYHS